MSRLKKLVDKMKVKKAKQNFSLHCGDCLDVLKTFSDNSVDSLVTDPPAGINFMGKSWDDYGHLDNFQEAMKNIFHECFRVMKPGAHGLVWAIPRTSHHTAMALERAGFEIRDVVTHLFGSGFPKSMDVSKAIDKQAGVERPSTPLVRCDGKTQSNKDGGGWKQSSDKYVHHPVFDGSTDDAKKWQGFGTALKPASEHWILIRKPISEKTVAENVLKHGTGAINIDASRIGYASEADKRLETRGVHVGKSYEHASGSAFKKEVNKVAEVNHHGRWPANVIFDEEAAKMLDEQTGELGKSAGGNSRAIQKNTYNDYGKNYDNKPDKKPCGFGDSGGASRFFYVAKASKSERNKGCEGLAKVTSGIGDERPSGQSMQLLDGRNERKMENHHPTVKPVNLMTYLIKLITPPNGTVLDPFTGSGSTGIAALLNGFRFIGIEREKEYFEIAEKRITNFELYREFLKK